MVDASGSWNAKKNPRPRHGGNPIYAPAANHRISPAPSPCFRARLIKRGVFSLRVQYTGYAAPIDTNCFERERTNGKFCSCFSFCPSARAFQPTLVCFALFLQASECGSTLDINSVDRVCREHLCLCVAYLVAFDGVRCLHSYAWNCLVLTCKWWTIEFDL